MTERQAATLYAATRVAIKSNFFIYTLFCIKCSKDITSTCTYSYKKKYKKYVHIKTHINSNTQRLIATQYRLTHRKHTEINTTGPWLVF